MGDLAPILMKEGVCFLSDHMDMGIAGHCHTIATARALVVILSIGTLSSHHQLQIIAHAKGLNGKGQGPVIIPANIFGFSFPSAHYFSQVLPQLWPEVSGEEMHNIGAFFSATSWPLALHASRQVLQAQTKAIIERVPRDHRPSDGVVVPLTCSGDVIVSVGGGRSVEV